MKRRIIAPPEIDAFARELDPRPYALPPGSLRRPASLLTQSLTDTGNAGRFVVLHRDTALYCHAIKAWLIWNGRKWVRDETDQIRLLGKATMIELFRQASDARNDLTEKFARASLDSKRITNMLREAQAELVITPADLDQHPDLLVFQNGTLNLKTGELGPHQCEHFITKMVRFDYRKNKKCDLFLNTMMRLMGAGREGSKADLKRAERMVDTLQKCIGYTLTGHTSEKVVFILFGFGNNGKTTILSLFLKLLEEMATLLQIETLMVRQENSNSQADLADLRGARFVMTSETEEGQRFAEGKLKRITQGMGKIKAVRKYENPIEFPETHKLWIDANHKPAIRGTDAAIWNRVFAIPFNVTIRAEEIDRDLQSKLMSEAEGILAWAVAGAVRWYGEGLGRPEEIAAAVGLYRAEMDLVGRFIEARCIAGAQLSVQTTALYAAFKQWAESAGEQALTQKAFSSKLLERPGISSQHKSGGNVFSGIACMDPE